MRVPDLTGQVEDIQPKTIIGAAGPILRVEAWHATRSLTRCCNGAKPCPGTHRRSPRQVIGRDHGGGERHRFIASELRRARLSDETGPGPHPAAEKQSDEVPARGLILRFSQHVQPVQRKSARVPDTAAAGRNRADAICGPQTKPAS
jgi:hypothetical protein